MGVNKNNVIWVMFLLGGLMVGAAVLLYLMKFGVTWWNVGFIFGVKVFMVVVFGGIGNVCGVLLGGFVFGLVENYGLVIFGL